MSRLNLLLLVLFCTRIRYTKAAEKCLKTIDMRECSGPGSSLTSPPTCSNVTVCQDIFNISTINIPPYSSELMPPMLEIAVRSCCGICRGMHYKSNFTSMKNFHDLLQTSAVTNSRFIFPILAEYNIDKVYGYHFVPLIDVQTGYYFVKKRKNSDTVNALLKACLGLWPLFLITLLLAFIAGAIGWICDTRYNEEEFPRPFVNGVLEGFWWSFISMTTVGYGDKSPKSAQARAFAVIWIIMGITICSMFTAALTSAITESSKLPVASMSGQKVAVLPDRLLDSTFVVDKGGTSIEGDAFMFCNIDLILYILPQPSLIYCLHSSVFRYKYNN
ncbi:uncharacterized protein LOC130625765 isoform X1 [Hydractinia symbiolongicarpus]|uniref:uncharacterized protein LOC130625765 isoform X1 n=1 Tax=Hydractinia symbiolongicarpus TaxID=13093 RepID=UPI002551311D|nr:uncharacterized protein LOC130625765 isoform X1 [Hydractinia symbiolongicarpus]XP_057296851.1 uncharacterized protein LOC130625765 isoform X1 [Hydractinia symbiolongicarpus]